MSTPLLLGRLFIKIVRTKIDIHSREITLEYDKETFFFNIFDVMNFPNDGVDNFG